jgi:hypothetical protein
MKKVFKLKEGNKNPQRQLDAIKHEIRKYIKREKRKSLPEDVDFWDMKCKFGKNDEEPQVIEFVDITKNIDEASEQDCDSIYVEIISTAGTRDKESTEEE